MTREEQARKQLESEAAKLPTEGIDAAFGVYGMSRVPVSARRVKAGKKLKRALKQAGGYTVNIIRRKV